jgi:uncharacterized protein YbjT (DUF2867 family)
MATYLVTCATGKQGGAAVRHLLKAGAKVHAVVRKPESESAQALREQGVVLFKGDNDSFDVFREAAKGCAGVFLVPLGGDNEAQVRQIRGIVRATAESGVEVAVVSSSVWTGRREKWDNEENRGTDLFKYYEAKAAVEGAVRDGPFKSWTILRPSWFHTNYLPPYVLHGFPELKSRGEFWHVLNDNAKMPHIDVDDIGKFAAAALLDPERFSGHEIELANENLTAKDSGAVLSKVSGRDIKVVRRPLPWEEVNGKLKNPATMFQAFLNHASFDLGDHELEKKYGIRMTTLQEFLEVNKDCLMEYLPSQTLDD